MRDVRKIVVAERIVVSPLDICLERWIDYQRYGDVDIGWRGTCCLLTSDSSADSEELCARMDDKVGKAVDMMVNSLLPHHRWAMMKACGIASLWRFPSLVFEDVVADAKKELEIKLRNNLATRSIFP